MSYARLAVVEPGFPEGALSTANVRAGTSRLAGLAVCYSNFADSDPVMKLMRKSGPIDGVIEIAPVTATPGSTDALPLISIAAIANSPNTAEGLAERQALALKQHVLEEQNGNRIPVDRVVLNVVKSPATAKIFQARRTDLGNRVSSFLGEIYYLAVAP